MPLPWSKQCVLGYRLNTVTTSTYNLANPNLDNSFVLGMIYKPANNTISCF